MTFVTFDAQDVITTSGPFVGQTMAAPIGAVIQYNNDSGAVHVSDISDMFLNQDGNTAGLNAGKSDRWLLYYGAGDDTNGFNIADGGSLEYRPTDDSYFYVDNANSSLIAGGFQSRRCSDYHRLSSFGKPISNNIPPSRRVGKTKCIPAVFSIQRYRRAFFRAE